MVEPYGAHLLGCGIAERWETTNLDAVFRSYWSDSDKLARYPALHFEEARPASPFPFCVLDVATPVDDGHSVGELASEEIKYERVTVNFIIHAKAAGAKDAKAVGEEIAGLLQRCFDPGTPALEMGPARHNDTISNGTWPVREGDQEYMVTVSYVMKIEGTYSAEGLAVLPEYVELPHTTQTGEILVEQPTDD